MRGLFLVVVFAVVLGGLAGCTPSNTAPAAGANGGPPPQNSGEHNKNTGKSRFPKPPH